MNTRKIILTLLFSVSILFVNIIPVSAQPPLPSSFYGTALLTGGGNVPDGTIISAWINNIQYAYSVVEFYAGKTVYTVDVPGDDPSTTAIEGGAPGDTVIFKIGDAIASQAAPWQFGTNINLDLTVTEVTYALTVSKDGTGSGVVTSNLAGISCGLDCTENYPYNAEVTLIPTADAGSRFVGWNGSECSGKSPCTVTMTSTKSVTATFKIIAFADVPPDYAVTLGGVTYPLFYYVEALWDAQYTAGCLTDPLRFCPDYTMTRAESAVFMLRGNFGAGYIPPPEPWGTFTDDWSLGTWAEKWAEGMWDAQLTAGCQVPGNPLKFCPWDLFPRDQAAVFGLRLKYGVSFTPDPASGLIFADMTDPLYFGTKWAEKAYQDGLLPACGYDSGNGKPLFCPSTLVTRAWAAYMIVKAKNLPLTP